MIEINPINDPEELLKEARRNTPKTPPPRFVPETKLDIKIDNQTPTSEYRTLAPSSSAVESIKRIEIILTALFAIIYALALFFLREASIYVLIVLCVVFGPIFLIVRIAKLITSTFRPRK